MAKIKTNEEMKMSKEYKWTKISKLGTYLKKGHPFVWYNFGKWMH